MPNRADYKTIGTSNEGVLAIKRIQDLIEKMFWFRPSRNMIATKAILEFEKKVIAEIEERGKILSS